MKKKNWIVRNLGWMIFLFLMIIIILLGIMFWSKIALFLVGLVPQNMFNNNNSGGADDGNNNQVTYSCTDSDEGLSYYMVGHVTDQDSLSYYDKCEDAVLLTEYYCSNNKVTIREFNCPSDYFCRQTRSGGSCEYVPQNSNGDVLSTDSGSGTTTQDNVFGIDMGSLGSGNCRISATLSTSWSYANDLCHGIQGEESVKWSFYDSDSLEYSRIDLAPIGLGVEIPCGLDYNGIPFRLEMEKVQSLPDCEIDYEWEVRLIACECQ